MPITEADRARAMEALSWLSLTSPEWQAMCHSHRAYTEDAPAMLSAAAAREAKLHEALQRISDMDPDGKRADDLGRAARIARDALGVKGGSNG